MRFLAAFLLCLCASPALAIQLPPDSHKIKPDCCGCGDCQCDQDCLCPVYVVAANGRRTILMPVNRHPMAAGVKQVVGLPFQWLVAPPRKLWAPVEVR